jgi:hypothetical protein
MITAAYWIASRAVHRVLGSQPIVEIELGDPSKMFDNARRDIHAALAEPPDDRRVTNLLVGAEACRRCGALSDDWQATLAALVGEPWPDRLFAGACVFVGQRWPHIQRVAGELLYERRVLVSRVFELCNLKELA